MIIKGQIKVLNKNKFFLVLSDILTGSRSTIVASTLSIVHLSSGFPKAKSSAMINSLAMLITSEYNSK